MKSAIYIILLITFIDLDNKVPSCAAEFQHRSPTSGQNLKLSSPFFSPNGGFCAHVGLEGRDNTYRGKQAWLTGSCGAENEDQA